jgi:triacylglycerol lipase
MNDYPIVLAHGIAPFDIWSPIVERFLGSELAAPWEYFKKIAPDLQNREYKVFTTHVSFAGGLEQRARELGEEVKNCLAASSQPKLHIIGHSMGGLDARCMIATNPEAGEWIASLTTIGTPHNGTPVADFWLGRKGGAVPEALDILRPILDLEGFEDLTTTACNERNRQWRASEAANQIFYQTYCSSVEKNAVFPPLRGAWQIIVDAAADAEAALNDGLVPVPSQRWQDPPKEIARRQFPFPADHLNEVGWWDVGELALGEWRPGKYEAQVRRIYLEIAQTVSALDA